MSPVVVIGFLGGFVRPDNSLHTIVQIAQRLRQDYASGVAVETFANRQGNKAYRQVLQLLDTDHDGKLSEAERRRARIVVYGHSWGASQTIALARRLEKQGIGVLLTIQVDSVAKPGEEDSVIPANVAEAVNFYQPSGLIHGQPEIRAADPSRTEILGNFRFDYSHHHVPCDQFPWVSRVFMKPHLEIECDPRVWERVEALIRAKLPALSVRAGKQGAPASAASGARESSSR